MSTLQEKDKSGDSLNTQEPEELKINIDWSIDVHLRKAGKWIKL